MCIRDSLHPERFEKWANEHELVEAFRLGVEEHGEYFDRVSQCVVAQVPIDYYKYEKGLLRPDGQPGFATPTGRVELWSTAYNLSLIHIEMCIRDRRKGSLRGFYQVKQCHERLRTRLVRTGGMRVFDAAARFQMCIRDRIQGAHHHGPADGAILP